MRISRTRPAGIPRRNDQLWMCFALFLCAGCFEQKETFRTHLDMRWRRFAQRQCDPLLEHELNAQRFRGVVTAFNDDRNLLTYSVRHSSHSPGNGNVATIQVLNMSSGQELSPLYGHSGSTQCIAFTRTGRNLVSGGRRYIKFWEVAQSKEIERADAHQGYIRCIACSPVSDLAASGGQDGSILVWNLKPLRVSQRLVGHSGGIRCLRWSSDGSSILSGSWDGSIRLWDLSAGRPRFTAQAGYGRVMSLDLTRDGRFAMSSYLNGPNQPVILWDIEKGQEINRFGVPGNPWHADQLLHIAAISFSPDGKTALFGAAFGSVIWWDVGRWRQIAHSLMHEEELTDVVFSADGEQAISVGSDGEMTVAQVNVWKLPEYCTGSEEPEGNDQRDKRETANPDEK